MIVHSNYEKYVNTNDIIAASRFKESTLLYIISANDCYYCRLTF